MGKQPARYSAQPRVPSQGQAPRQTNRHDCSKCTMTFTKKADYERHFASHKDTRSHTCDVCSKSFAQKTALETHKNTHTGERPHPCRAFGCNKTFGDPSSRTRHEKEIHDPSNGYKCRKCDHTCKRRDQFRRHFKDCFKQEIDEDWFNEAREHCKNSYVEQAAKGETPEEVTPRPPKRKRRGAIAVVSPQTSPEEYDEDEDVAQRQTPPRYEPMFAGELSSDSTVTARPNFYRDTSQFDETAYGGAFEPAYSLPAGGYYSDHSNYTSGHSSSPSHHFDYAYGGSSRYVRELKESMVGGFHHSRAPTTESSFSTVGSPPEYDGNRAISGSHMPGSPRLTHSPHLSGPNSPVLMHVSSRSTTLFDQVHGSPSFVYSETSYEAIEPTDRIPRSGFVGHAQSHQQLHQYHHYPYIRERRSDIMHDHPGSPTLNGPYGTVELDTDFPPLSLAGARAVKLDSYESVAPY